MTSLMNLAFYTLWTWESGRWHNYFQIFERQSCGKRHTWILVTQQSTFKLKDRNYREEREEWLKHPQRKMCQHYHAEGLWEQIIRKRNPGNKVKERNVGNTCQIEEWTKSYSGKIQVYTSWFFEKKKNMFLLAGTEFVVIRGIQSKPWNDTLEEFNPSVEDGVI